MSVERAAPRQVAPGAGCRIFLSYRREDSSGYAGRLYADLVERFGESCVFMDIASLVPGVDFVDAIEQTMAACDTVLVMMGRTWLHAAGSGAKRRLDDPEDFVRLEVEAALTGSHRVVPILVGGATMPDARELPESLARLARCHAIELSDRRWPEDVRDLAGAIEGARGRQALRTETLTFLFTDIEGSTLLLGRLGDAYAEVLADHHSLIRAGLAAHGGKEIGTQGDGFFAVFSSPSACVAAVIEMQRALVAHHWPAGEHVRVRMGVHCGEASESSTGLVGLEVHRAARIAAAAHGGQVLLSASAAALTRDSLPAGASLRDLGRERLKDLARPEQLFQLEAAGLEVDFPPPRSLHAEPQSNLPMQLSSFVGRHHELDELRGMIGPHRLVTLTGPGGCGKTRLALQIAAELLDGSGDGVWLVELAPLAGPDQVAARVANTIGIREDPNRPVIDTLVDVVAGRELLLVLDNCEHVIDSVAKLADALLRSCPRVVLLATSREPLSIAGEQVYQVLSLAVPTEGETDPEQVRAYESVRLLLERAAEHQPGFTLSDADASVIGRICRRLDGMPLAIELAAARLRSLSPTDLDARLDERFRLLTGGSRTALARQQTLRALVDWSWDLLNGPEKSVLARLSVFAGGFDLGAAEAVAVGPDVEAYEVLSHLGALVDKSLVQADETAGHLRYSLLETVRQYGADKLAERGEAELDRARAAHLEHYVVLAETAELQLRGPDQVTWLERLDLEHDNMRTALAHSLTRGDPASGLRLGTALDRYWGVRGHHVEAVDVLTALLALPATQAATLVRARALSSATYHLQRVGRGPVARACAEEALVIARTAADDQLLADVLGGLGRSLFWQGDRETALSFAEEALVVARRAGDRYLTTRALELRSNLLIEVGDADAAYADLEEALLLARQIGDRLRGSSVLSNLGDLALKAGDVATARRRLAEALDIHRDIGYLNGLSARWNLGVAEYLDADSAAARELFTECINIARRLGDTEMAAYALLGCSLTLAHAGEARVATVLHGAVDAAMEEVGIPFQSLEAGLRDGDHARLRAALGDEAFDSAYQEGREMPYEEAVGLALRGGMP